MSRSPTPGSGHGDRSVVILVRKYLIPQKGRDHSVVTNLRRARRDHARDSGQVGDHAEPVPSRQQSLHVIQAGEAEFHDQPSSETQHAPGISSDAVVKLEAGLAGEQCHVRLEIAHLAL